MRKIVLRDLHQDSTLERKARTAIAGGARGVVGTLDGGPGRVVITEWHLFTLGMRGKVTYK